MAQLSRKLSEEARAAPAAIAIAAPLAMTLRRKSREFALQMLFEWDMTRQEPDARRKSFSGNRRAPPIRRANSRINCSRAPSPERRASGQARRGACGKLEARTARGHRSQHSAAGDLRTALGNRAPECGDRRSARTGEEIFLRRSACFPERHSRRRAQANHRVTSRVATASCNELRATHSACTNLATSSSTRRVVSGRVVSE